MEGQWRDKGGTREGQGRDKGGTREGQGRDKGGTREGQGRDKGGEIIKDTHSHQWIALHYEHCHH